MWTFVHHGDLAEYSYVRAFELFEKYFIISSGNSQYNGGRRRTVSSRKTNL